MKKHIALLLACALAIGILAGCGNSKAAGTAKNEDGKINIVTTIFPEYDWIRQLLGTEAERVNLTMLLDNGVDLHSYQPSVEDIAAIADCDLFVYIGGESDLWVEQTLAQAGNDKMVAVNLMEVLGDKVKAEEQVDGMQAEDEREHEGEAAHTEEAHEGEAEHTEEAHEGEHEHEDGAPDEHIWLSLRNAETLCTALADKLKALPLDGAVVQANLENYTQQLKALDAEYQKAVDASARKTLLFGDRFPFRYLVDDYGLSYYAAFAGCSAETEASFETVAFLSDKVEELDLPSVIRIEGTQHKIAQTVAENAKDKQAEVLTMDSMQGIDEKRMAEGITYLSLMEQNLAVLKQALGA